ncbi:MAG TPA: hypothetical protein VIG96_03445 [Blastococcus sp.]|jgi:hypothetical protein
MNGPFLYDDDPAPLHTGTPRRAIGPLAWIFGGTVAFALLMVVLMPAVRGSSEDQAKEVAGVFVAALAHNDTETAYGLLCQKERVRLSPDEVAGAYLGEGTGTLGAVRDAGDARLVPVTWSDGTSSELTVIGEDGPRVCGVAAAG